MKTTKPISTISFNSTEFLKQKCEELYKAGILEFYALIPHKGETDETGPEAVQKKDHSHLYAIPAYNMQTEDLRKEFNEPDPENPKNPKGVLPFHRSNDFGDWCLYGLHDEAYLLEKDLKKEYHYKYEDIVTSDKDELYRLYSSIDMRKLMPYNEMIKAVFEGVTFSEFVNTKRMPIKQIAYWSKAWDLISYDMANKYGISNASRTVKRENKRKIAGIEMEIEDESEEMTEVEEKAYYDKLCRKSKVYWTEEEEEWLANYETKQARKQEEKELKASNRASFNLSEIDKGKKEEEE